MEKIKVGFTTFGCRANNFDTDYLMSRARDLSIEVSKEIGASDYQVVNTCTVTHNADVQVRKMIRRIHRESPETKILVTGCMATRDGDNVEQMEGVHKVFKNPDKYELIEWIAREHDLEALREKDKFLYNFDHRCRPFLKIQDGCEAKCTFCIIPSTRGRNRSWSSKEVLNQINLLSKKGFPEVVLTGIHLACYGHDIHEDIDLFKLIHKIHNETDLKRLRISSLEPMELKPEFMTYLAESEVFCHHLHLPLQSGSNRVLELMERGYTREEFSAIVSKAFELMPDISIGSDVMVGFPGESDADFDDTAELCEQLPFSYLHCFPYSDRPGTVAEAMKDKVDPRKKKERMKVLKKISNQKKAQFLDNQIGKQLEVLWEHFRNDTSQGISRNYVTCVMEDKSIIREPGTLSVCEVVAIKDGKALVRELN